MRASFVVSLLFVLPSCATIVSPGPWSVPIASDPAGAVVTYQGNQVGVTPCVVPMRRRCSQVELELAGHHKHVVEVGTQFNGWFFGNIIFGGLIGVAVDAISGATQVINDNAIMVALVQDSLPAPSVWQRSQNARTVPTSEEEGWVSTGN